MGLGCDVAHIPRIAAVFERHGERFLRRAFHPRERLAAAELQGRPLASFLASRWAAKEAVFKAFGSGHEPRVDFLDIEIVGGGPPVVKLHGRAGEAAKNKAVEISISHDGDYAFAVATVSHVGEVKE